MEAALGTEMIAPKRQGRRVQTQAGRPRRREARRWQSERRFAGRFNCRRLVGRSESQAENVQGLLQRGAVGFRWRDLGDGF